MRPELQPFDTALAARHRRRALHLRGHPRASTCRSRSRAQARTASSRGARRSASATPIELPLPVDHRTNDADDRGGVVEPRAAWRASATTARGSTTRVETLIWDNPLRFTDQTHASAYSTGDGSSQGRMALWPDSTAHTVSASGSRGAARAQPRRSPTSRSAPGCRTQQLLPHTINTAIAPIPLARDSAEAEARITSMNYRVDVAADADRCGSAASSGSTTTTTGRRTFPVDAVRPSRRQRRDLGDRRQRAVRLHAALRRSRRLGHAAALHRVSRRLRPASTTTGPTGFSRRRPSDVLRASIDSTGLGLGLGAAAVRPLRAHRRPGSTRRSLERHRRAGLAAPVRHLGSDPRPGQRHRPGGARGTRSASASRSAVGQENRPDAAFGLQDNDMRVDHVRRRCHAARDGRRRRCRYGFENYSTLQRSRQANPGVQFNDPTRDWATDMDENVHTLAFSSTCRS